MKAWHFLRPDGCMRDGTPVVIGETYRIAGEPILCERGFHGSIRPLDALRYAQGAVVCRTVHSGTIVHGYDKLVSSERRVLWMYDATDVLRRFARLCALDVTHLWDAPEIVVRYLRTGDESLMSAAGDAALRSATARGEAWPAARGAAWTAARAATWDAAWDAARYAAWGAQNRRMYRMLMKGRP